MSGKLELPVEFPAELDAPCGIGGRDGSEIAVAQIGVWLEEVRMVETLNISRRNCSFLARRGPPFFDARVIVEEFRRSQIRQESRSIAKGVGRRLGKRRRIDPVIESTDSVEPD